MGTIVHKVPFVGTTMSALCVTTQKYTYIHAYTWSYVWKRLNPMLLADHITAWQRAAAVHVSLWTYKAGVTHTV